MEGARDVSLRSTFASLCREIPREVFDLGMTERSLGFQEGRHLRRGKERLGVLDVAMNEVARSGRANRAEVGSLVSTTPAQTMTLGAVAPELAGSLVTEIATAPVRENAPPCDRW